MADHKNQHFVPRCVLRPFSLDGEGRAINLYAFGQQKLIQNAPLKNQCARDYMYGKDGVLESVLAKTEGGYNEALKRAINNAESEIDLNDIRFFAFLQLRRTEIAITRMKEAQAKMADQIFDDEEKPEEPPMEWFMTQSLKSCIETRHFLEDLKVRIIENRTATNFVISDDPAVFTNRYIEQKHSGETFGAGSSGLILSMPLTPRLAVICYDGQVYTIPTLVNQRMVLTKSQDVESLNELQYLKAAASIYFRPWADAEYVRAKFEETRNRRVEDWVSVSLAFFVKDEDGGEIYQEGTREEAKAAGRALVHTRIKYPAPSVWLSQLKFRHKPKAFFEGTGAGHVRKAEWLRG